MAWDWCKRKASSLKTSNSQLNLQPKSVLVTPLLPFWRCSVQMGWKSLRPLLLHSHGTFSPGLPVVAQTRVFWAYIAPGKHLMGVIKESRYMGKKSWTKNSGLGSHREISRQETLLMSFKYLKNTLGMILLFQSCLIFSWIKENYESFPTTLVKASHYSSLL